MYQVKQKGFTLIELMTVVTIIGILAALALPMYNYYTARAQAAEGESLLKGLKTPLVEAVSSGSIAECNNQAAWFANEVSSGNYIDKIEVSNNAASKQCLLVAMFKTADVNDVVNGRKISVRYTMTNGAWECGSNLPAGVASSACRGSLLTVSP